MALNLLNRSKMAVSRVGPRPISTLESALFQGAREEALRQNPYYKKYEAKIENLKRDQPEEYAERLRPQEVKRHEEPSNVQTSRLLAGDLHGGTELLPVDLKQKTALADIVKLELLEDKTQEEIEYIWREFHKNLDCLSSVLREEVFRRLESRARAHPVFLLPLPRKDGYEFVVCQHRKGLVNFVRLADWQEVKDAAPVVLSLVYYDDLVEPKGLALMRGRYDARVISLLEAQCLANSLHMYYADDHPRRTALLDRFTHDPENFRHTDLIAEVESLTL